jgi:hypothetical protein
MRLSAYHRINVLLNNKHAALKTFFGPLLRLSVIVVQADMTKLINNGQYCWITPSQNCKVVVVNRIRCNNDLLSEERGRRRCSRDIGRM